MCVCVRLAIALWGSHPLSRWISWINWLLMAIHHQFEIPFCRRCSKTLHIQQYAAVFLVSFGTANSKLHWPWPDTTAPRLRSHLPRLPGNRELGTDRWVKNSATCCNHDFQNITCFAKKKTLLGINKKKKNQCQSTVQYQQLVDPDFCCCKAHLRTQFL